MVIRSTSAPISQLIRKHPLGPFPEHCWHLLTQTTFVHFKLAKSFWTALDSIEFFNDQHRVQAVEEVFEPCIIPWKTTLDVGEIVEA